jgi:hypothetical protein
MKLALILGVVFSATLAVADEAGDRAAIETVIRSLKTTDQPKTLFTADADSDLGRLRAIEESMAKAASRPWSEIAPPALVLQPARFISPDIALVDAAETQLGVIARKVPVLFVMKKEASGWKIASLRVLSTELVTGPAR